MKIEPKKIITIILITIAIGIVLLPNKTLAVSGKPELNVETTKPNLDLGEEFTVSVKFNDNGSTECLGFDFGLKYDKTVLEVVNSNIIIEKGATVLNDKTPGSVNFVLVSIMPVQYTGELFSVTFRVKQDAGGGESALRLLSDNSDFPIENENGGVETTIQAAKINIQAPAKQNTTKFEIISETSETENIKDESNEKENIVKNETNTEKQNNNIDDTENIIEETSLDNKENTTNTKKMNEQDCLQQW